VIPLHPQHIAVVTSADGAVLQDIRQTFENARVPVNLVVYPCSVQGKNCVESVLEQLRTICEQSEDETDHAVPHIDLVLIARGGGSREDLWSFNQPLLLRAIDAMRGVGTLPPIACAIGHQTDTPLLDDVCDASFITPTYAAQHIAQSFVNLLTSARSMQVQMRTNIRQVLQQMHSRYQVLTRTVQNHSPHTQLFSHTQHLHQRLQTCIHQLLSTIHTTYSRLHYAVHKDNPTRTTVQQLYNQHALLKQSVQSVLHVLSTKWRTLHNTTQNSTPWSLFTRHENLVMLKEANGMKDKNVLDVITQRIGKLAMVTPYGLIQINYEVVTSPTIELLPTTKQQVTLSKTKCNIHPQSFQ
jgi:exodeoxyribonuclease VII large subunit